MVLPGTQAPALSVPLVSGGTWSLDDSKPEAFTIVVVYRGKHCPICNKYLNSIQDALDQAESQGIDVIAVSMNDADAADAAVRDWGLDRLRVGYGMSQETADAWGLFVSSGREGTAEPAVFAEPGLFVIRPDGTVFFAQSQSAPFTRPDFTQLLGGLDFVVKNDYPARGDLTKAA